MKGLYVLSAVEEKEPVYFHLKRPKMLRLCLLFFVLLVCIGYLLELLNM